MRMKTGRLIAGERKRPKLSKENLLWQACTEGDLILAKELLDDPEVNVNFQDESYKRTPFYRACFYGHTAIVELMLHDPRVQLNLQQSEGATPFKAACQEGRTGVVKLLLRQGAKVINYCLAQQQGESPFFTACQNDRIDVAKLLLKNPTIDVNTPALDGATPIWVAAQEGHLDLIKILLASGRRFDLGSSPYRDGSPWGGKTPVEWALVRHHWRVALLLHDYSENPCVVRKQLIKELRLPAYMIPHLFAVLILFSDDYFALRANSNPKIKRFLTIGARLPMDLQMALANRAYGSAKDIVSIGDSEDAFKDLFLAYHI